MLGPRHILVVEDNPADVRLMREALRELQPPVTLHVAADGEETIHFLERQGAYANAPRPHLIFLDFNLPKSDARELLKKIKENHHFRIIPVAVLTTSDAARDVRQAYELCANCYLRKPGDLDGFFNTIREAARFWLDVAYIPTDIEVDAEKKSHLL